MKAVTIKQLKDELSHKSATDLKELCLQLARFKKENKELLTYLLFESHDEEKYIQTIKEEVDAQFEEINTKSFFYIRKGSRKILTAIKKHIRYSKKKETEADLLLYFCKKLKDFSPSIHRSTRLQSIFDTQIRMIKRVIEKLHEDLQYDFQLELDELLKNE
jgi:peptide subunit release factor 1 (eRF1)|tara:strand:+ start:2295 stop:2777 length:483 start_codon:yes stop_codon:yes gene_type:complete